ncbi:aminotransferase class I/II-fold pyridoxal phosphate-dependent enzyme [Swingsia samuiensis]|uniref:8-amino-7-oxononanoate synthase n=1 Tax=Swingsia samuiensis TaxID=1293412 RepID=A0A4Y6UHR1_9PROT|nr:8-amino-7-oxononanoate synthase [Swingsia samuiensis]QDH17113.1 8-amino-7-oxononanoate synthase [Swingsia samuiensis]
MTLFDSYFAEILQKRSQEGTLRTLHSTHNHSADKQATPFIDVSSNDYLNLSCHPLLKQRASEWALKYGAGARSSRLVSGTLIQHQNIEAKIALFKKHEAALLFASGWQANASVIPALCKLSLTQTHAPMLVFSDKLNHASIHHGCAAAGVRQIRFRHNDLSHLESLLKREASKPGLRMIITESVFSMDGDRADILALRKIAHDYQAFLYLDEAHATGVLGENGAGLSQGVADLTMGTFSKALGSMGAYIAGSKLLCDYIINYASGFIYSTAVPPALLGAIDAALDLIPHMHKERHNLHKNADLLRRLLNEADISTGLSTTQIVPVIIGDSEHALSVARGLHQKGFMSIAIRPPTVPTGTARLRLALHSNLTENNITQLAHAIIQLMTEKKS